MNIWVKSILIGLLTAALAFFLYQKNSRENKRQLFTVHCLLQIIPERKSLSGTGHAENIDAVLNMSVMLTRRCKAAGYVAEIKEAGKALEFEVTIHHVDDTIYLRRLIIAGGKLEIREMYTFSEIAPMIRTDNPVIENTIIEPSPVENSNDSGQSVKISELAKPKPQQPHQSAFDTIFTFNNNVSGSEIGLVREQDTAALTTILHDPKLLESLPADNRFYYGPADINPRRKGDKLFNLYAIRTNGEEKALIDNNDIKSAVQDYTRSGMPQVAFSFNAVGTRKWEMMTRKNKGRHLAVILDNLVITAPVVNEAITGGNSTIQGGFTVEEAQILSHQLNSGTLPARLIVLKQETTPETNGSNGRILLLVGVMLAVGTALSYFIFNALKNK